MMSCKNAIKANHYIKPSEAQSLLDQLSQAKNPYNCPHGRPVLIHFSQTDIEKKCFVAFNKAINVMMAK